MLFCADQTARYLRSPTVDTTVNSTARSLFGSGLHPQATLYLFQKNMYFAGSRSTSSVARELLLLRLYFVFCWDLLLLNTKLFPRNCTVLRDKRHYFCNKEKTFGASWTVSRFSPSPPPLPKKNSLYHRHRARRDQAV